MARLRRKRTAAKDLGPSPNPLTTLILTDIALRGVGRLTRRLTERQLLKMRYDRDLAKKMVNERSIKQTLMASVAARVATTSVPGALVVGGGLLGKTLFDRVRGRKAEIEGEKKLLKRAKRAED